MAIVRKEDGNMRSVFKSKNLKKSRKERRAEARKNKTEFEPMYNLEKTIIGTYEEYHGVGYERFNSKFVTIKQVEEDSKYYFEQK